MKGFQGVNESCTNCLMHDLVIDGRWAGIDQHVGNRQIVDDVFGYLHWASIYQPSPRVISLQMLGEYKQVSPSIDAHG